MSAVQEPDSIRLEIDPSLAFQIKERRIEIDDIKKVIAHACSTGHVFVNMATGHHLAWLRPSTTTYWVEYRPKGTTYEIACAYSHRMMILEGFNMPPKTPGTDLDWLCGVCNIPLEQATVKLTYLDETFGADLPSCPSCQRVLVSEENAVQKMLLAEKMLEDK